MSCGLTPKMNGCAHTLLSGPLVGPGHRAGCPPPPRAVMGLDFLPCPVSWWDRAATFPQAPCVPGGHIRTDPLLRSVSRGARPGHKRSGQPTPGREVGRRGSGKGNGTRDQDGSRVTSRHEDRLGPVGWEQQGSVWLPGSVPPPHGFRGAKKLPPPSCVSCLPFSPPPADLCLCSLPGTWEGVPFTAPRGD